jgi:DNA-binding LacI/PurR family transcriptional regulator
MTYDEWFIYEQISQRFSNLNYRVFMVRTQTMQPIIDEIISAVNPSSADGAIIIDCDNPDLVNQLAGMMPLVVLGTVPRKANVDYINTDEVVLGRKLTEMAIERGHRRIAVQIPSLSTECWSSAVKGYRLALEAAGIEYDPALVVERRGRLQNEIIDEIVGCQSRPTAIMAWTNSEHHQAYMSILKSKGYRVPEDISYIGWLNQCSDYERSILPDITCLNSRSWSESWANTAANRLISRISEPDTEPEQILITCAIHQGKTLADIR